MADSLAAPADGGALRSVVRDLAHEARDRAVAPERLLVSFKAIWQDEAAAHPAVDRRVHAELYEQMISLCIREYFAT